MFLALDGWRSWQGRQLTIQADFTETSNLARSLAQHAHDTIQGADSILVGLRDIVENDGMSPEQARHLQRLGADWIRPLPAVHGLFVFDAHGAMVFNSLSLPPAALNGGREDYFIYHRDHADRDIHIGGLLRCVTNCSWIISVSRRIDAADGSYAGVVMASLSIDVLEHFYATFDKGRHGLIGVLTTRGILLAREPRNGIEPGIDASRGNIFTTLLPRAPFGSFEENFPSDHIRRFGSYRTVEGYPLLVVVAHGVGDVLAHWASDALMHLIIGLVVSGVLLFVGSRFALQLRRREAADRRVAALNVELALQAATDALTGLFNRRRFDQKLLEEWHLAEQARSSLSLLLIDVDRFKLYNDRYGHQKGDECLRAVADVIAGMTRRPRDLVARYGGEEIVVLLVDTDEAAAAGVGERIRIAIERKGTLHADNLPLSVVTASIGVAALKPRTDRATAEALVAAADVALYAAKRRGRNMVVSWSETKTSDAVTRTSSVEGEIGLEQAQAHSLFQ